MDWFERLKDLYIRGIIPIEKLDKSVEKGLITEKERNQIVIERTVDKCI